MIKDFLYEEYEVIVWITPDTLTKYYFKKIYKLNPTHIVAVELNGGKFEMKTVGPFNYQVKKIH
jgi:hypothetical protein